MYKVTVRVVSVGPAYVVAMSEEDAINTFESNRLLGMGESYECRDEVVNLVEPKPFSIECVGAVRLTKMPRNENADYSPWTTPAARRWACLDSTQRSGLPATIVAMAEEASGTLRDWFMSLRSLKSWATRKSDAHVKYTNS